jgi:hypothetical protein
MRVSDLGKDLHNLVLQNSHDYSPHYNKFEEEFMQRYHQFQGLKNEVRIDMSNKSGYDLVKLSLLLSDFTSIFPYDKKKFLYTFDPQVKERKIIGTKNYLDKIAKEIPNSSLYAGYGSVSEEIIEEVFETFYPLIEANKIFIRPEKIIFVVDLHGSGRAAIHPADPNGASDEWRIISEEYLQASYPLFDKSNSIENYKKLSDVIVPYIKGISIDEYAKIILDEEDLLSSFRLQTKNYLNLIQKNNPDVEEFKNDVIQPKLDLLNRKFKIVTNNHRMKIAGATIGSAGLMLLSLTQSGMIAALSQFISFGLGTVGFVKSEAEYQENIDKLKDIPEYLLWRLSKK